MRRDAEVAVNALSRAWLMLATGWVCAAAIAAFSHVDGAAYLRALSQTISVLG